MPSNLVQKGMAQTHRAIFRATKGRIGGKLGKPPVLLLTTIGRTSGQPRTTPLFFQPDGDRLVVIASNGGSSRHPSWYLNLLANPDVTVELEGQSPKMRARTASDDSGPGCGRPCRPSIRATTATSARPSARSRS